MRAENNDKDAMGRRPLEFLLWLTAAVLLALAGPAAFAVTALTLPSATCLVGDASDTIWHEFDVLEGRQHGQ